MVNPTHQVRWELHCARLHLMELDQALMALTKAGWNQGSDEQVLAWGKLSDRRERQAGTVTRLEEELRELMR